MVTQWPNQCQPAALRKKFGAGEFNLLLETVDLDDSVGHLFVVDIFFDYKKHNAKTMKYLHNIQRNISTLNWNIYIYILDANEFSVSQLIKLYSETNKGLPNSYHSMPKDHATLLSRKPSLCI